MTSTVWDAVAARARRDPGAVAVRGECTYTYRELLDRAEALAATILARFGTGQVIAVEAETPGAGVVAVLAAARAQCPFLPVNPASPPAHRATLMTDGRPALTLREVDGGGFTIEADTETARAETARAVQMRGGGKARDGVVRDLKGVAYVIYTSGSTGKPKGVVVTHEAFLDRLHALAAVPGFGPGDSFLAMSTLTFDIALIELLLPLTIGGCVIAAPPATRLDPATFTDVVAAHHPSVIQATPSFWRLALAWGWTGSPSSRLWCGGEILTPNLARNLMPRCAELWNIYGPTEGTLWATAGRVEDPESISLGRPLPGVGLYLCDDGGAPIGEPGRAGEIVLHSASLADGYLRRPELTARLFGVHATPDGTRRSYRTGDRARFRDDGTLEFLGRTDGQIKLRGHRIELAGLEAVAEDHPAVSEAVAVVRAADNPETAHIAMFVVADGSVTGREIRQWMAGRLPAGMRPAHVSIRPVLPRTTTGKVDRIALATS